MIDQPTTIGKETLNQQSFKKLLDWLNPDQEKAAIKYEKIRLQLIRFFQFNDCPYSEDCADDVIQRVGKRLIEGVEVKADDPFIYFRAVARNTLLEYWKDRRRKDIGLDDLPPSSQPFVNPYEIEKQEIMARERERAVECMPKCLNELPEDNRQIFLRYHQTEQKGHIELRSELAKELGLEINALRSRITRIRDKMEKCIRNCLER